MSEFDGKHILVTGGTGSFGKRFIRTLLDEHKPERVIVFSRDEFKQSEMEARYPEPQMRFFLGDVRDRERVMRAFENVDIVVHAAALKQVPKLEYNPMEAIKTNIIGTENVIQAALASNVKKVLFVSTDKAAAPLNLYGSTKLAAEKMVVAANNIAGSRDLHFSVVRYGNVVGSRGSVIPFFQRLQNEGAKELPITDERMTRFYLTLDEGVAFVVNSIERMQGGEVFLPKVPSADIKTLAEAVAPGLPLKVVGIRPGEKLHEVLAPKEVAQNVIEFDDFFTVKPEFQFRNVEGGYETTANGEKGKPVAEDFEYNSLNNPHYLNVDELRTVIEKAMPFDG